jgi:hypothetical protein
MFIPRKPESTRPQWPFHPWPARRRNAVVGWMEGRPEPGCTRALSKLWKISLLGVVMVGVIMSAGVAIARLLPDESAGDAPPAASQLSKEKDDESLGALLVEHRRVVRGY